jgi:hypothetical protein
MSWLIDTGRCARSGADHDGARDPASGPVKVQSSGGVPRIATERLAWKVGANYNSIMEMTGLPGNQLTDTYLFAWYNNATMGTELRFRAP